jgi:hypothetical protein
MMAMLRRGFTYPQVCEYGLCHLMATSFCVHSFICITLVVRTGSFLRSPSLRVPGTGRLSQGPIKGCAALPYAAGYSTANGWWWQFLQSETSKAITEIRRSDHGAAPDNVDNAPADDEPKKHERGNYRGI